MALSKPSPLFRITPTGRVEIPIPKDKPAMAQVATHPMMPDDTIQCELAYRLRHLWFEMARVYAKLPMPEIHDWQRQLQEWTEGIDNLQTAKGLQPYYLTRLQVPERQPAPGNAPKNGLFQRYYEAVDKAEKAARNANR